jgi:hypothetical protein
MAETVEREASKLRLLGMASDYEARAKAAAELTGPAPGAPAPAEAIPVEPTPTEASPTEAIKVRLSRKPAKELNGAV